MIGSVFKISTLFSRMAASLLPAIAILGVTAALDADHSGRQIAAAQSACPDPVYGRQPYPYEMKPTFNKAGLDRLGSAAPTLPQIWQDYPPVRQIDPYVPCILLKAIAYTESTGWKQFVASYGAYGYTFLTDNSTSCDMGVMQLNTGTVGAFDQNLILNDYVYNIGVGTHVLITKWNELPNFIGNNNPFVVEDWYYAVWAYNGWVWENNPNHPLLYPGRDPWACGQDVSCMDILHIQPP